MDRDTVVRLANEVGARMGFVSSTFTKQEANPANLIYADFYAEELDSFATLFRNAVLEEAAVKCEGLWHEEVTAAVNGTQQPKYHDCIECSSAIRALKDQP